MNSLYYSSIIGIDVAACFSIATTLKPDGSVYQKNMRINHDLTGFKKILFFIQKVEEEFNSNPVIFLESTGIYHLTLLHFLLDHHVDARLLNPLITNSNKNSNIRKAKTDKLDSYKIATLCKTTSVKRSIVPSKEFWHLKTLVREYHRINEEAAKYKTRFTNAIYVSYPGLNRTFSDIAGNSAMVFFQEYPTPKALLTAHSEDVITLLRKASKRGEVWAVRKYNLIVKVAQEATQIGVNHDLFEHHVQTFISFYTFHKEHVIKLEKKILEYITNASFAHKFNHELDLLLSFPGIGKMTAITLLCEMNDFDNFSKANQLVAFFGVDPGVNQSGNFVGDKNKMSKRGTALGRKVLYSVALSSVRKSKNGKAVNQVLYDYYHQTLKAKKKKVRLVAIMNKLLRYIFSIFKNDKPYVMRHPKLHKRMFLETNKTASVA